VAKKPKILQFFGLWHFVMLPVGDNLRKLNMGTQLQTFAYPTVSKSFLSNAFMAKSSAQTLIIKSVQTDKTRMWTNAQRDGRPAEYRWRPLLNTAKFA